MNIPETMTKAFVVQSPLTYQYRSWLDGSTITAHYWEVHHQGKVTRFFNQNTAIFNANCINGDLFSLRAIPEV